MSNLVYFKATALSVLTLAVVACGGDGVTGLGSGNSGASQDSFFKIVSEIVATSPEDSEPREIDSISATSPENSEPALLDG